MATGDITNNVRKMRSRMKEIKYSDEVDMDAIGEGLPTAYLPIYHYAFTTYSPAVAQLILDKGIEIFGKSDSRFMEAVYRILRDLFAYKPSITKEQFFAKGFAERKIIMCADILQLVKKKHSELNPSASKTTMRTGVRPKSAPVKKNLPLAVPKTKRTSDVNRNVCQASHVINELTSATPPEPYRHLSTSASHIHPVRHVVSHNGDTSTSSASSDPESIPQKPPSVLTNHAAMLSAQSKSGKHVTIVQPHTVRITSPEDCGSAVQSQRNFNDTQDDDYSAAQNFMTPSVRKFCPRSVEVVSIPRGVYDNGDASIVEIQAPTSDSVLQGPIPDAQHDIITNLYQTVETLTGQVMQMAKTSKIENQPAVQNTIDHILSKIENLTARIVLVENRLSILEAKQPEDLPNGVSNSDLTASATFKPISHSGPSKPTQDSSPVTEPQTNEIHTQKEPFVPESLLPICHGPGASFAEELRALPHSQKSLTGLNFSIGYSPIRKVGNGLAGSIMTANEETFVSANENTLALETEEDPRRASTPTLANSVHYDFSHLETKDTVSRINNMLKETELMFKNNKQHDDGN